MTRRLFESLLARGSEMLVALGLVGVFALIFLATLMIVFPKGTGLVKVYGDIFGQDSEARRATAGSAPSAEDEERVVAVLAEVVRNVKDRPGNAVAWASSQVGTTIDDGHAVQTLAGSGAALIVGEKSELRMGENSLVVFRRETAGASSRSKRAALVLMGGQLLGTIPAAGSGTAPIDIVAGSATTEVRARGRSPADFAVSVDADKKSTFTLYSGEAEVSAGGRTLVLQPNQAVTISPSGVAARPAPIPASPQPIAPAAGHSDTFATVAPPVDFRWDAVPGAERYRLVIARDAAFTEIEHDQELSETRLVHRNLRPGTHHWRVSSLAGRVESKPGPERSLQVVQDQQPPRLNVEIPAEVAGTNRLVIHGTTDPGSRITIGNETVPTSATGSFEYALVLKEGLNMIVIEATDAAGNGSFVSKYVNARF